METISASNGTGKFLKPLFKHSIYEEVAERVFGCVKEKEDLGKGKLCWVWDGPESENQDKEIIAVIRSKEHVNMFGDFGYCDVLGNTWDHAQPLTKEEVLEYIVGGV